MLKKISVMFVLGYGSMICSGDHKNEDRDVEESKDGSCEPKYFEPAHGCAPLDFLSAHEAKVGQLPFEQQCILAEILYNKDKSQAKELPIEIQRRLVNWKHLPQDFIQTQDLESSLMAELYLQERLAKLKAITSFFEKSI